MTAVTIERELPAARAKLHDAISNLIDPRPQHIEGQTVWLDPRYHELREALTGPGGAAGGHKPRSQPPAWLDAIDLLQLIDKQVRQLEPDAKIAQCDDYPTVQRLRIHAARKWTPPETETIIATTRDLEKHVADIDHLFAQRPIYLPNPCPNCGKTTTTRRLDGETVRVPALQIGDNGNSGCTCNHCHAHWNDLEWLGLVLGYPRIEGVIG